MRSSIAEEPWDDVGDDEEQSGIASLPPELWSSRERQSGSAAAAWIGVRPPAPPAPETLAGPLLTIPRPPRTPRDLALHLERGSPEIAPSLPPPPPTDSGIVHSAELREATPESEIMTSKALLVLAILTATASLSLLLVSLL